MDRHHHRARARALLLAGTLLASLAVPLAVSADTNSIRIPPAASNGATIEIGTIRVLSKVVANVEVSFTCDPFMVYDWATGETRPSTVGRIEGGQVALIQGSGKTVNTAWMDLFGGEVTCDGSDQSMTVALVASTTPWKTGAAVAGANLYIVDEAFSSSHSASTGAMSVKVTK